LIREIAARGRIISSVAWDQSIIWAIYEHVNSKNSKKRHNCFYVVHSDGVALLEHDGRYQDLRITNNNTFKDISLKKDKIKQNASQVDFEQTKIWSSYAGSKYNNLLVIKDKYLFKYHISDNDDRYLH